MKEKEPNNILYYGLLIFFLVEYIRPDQYIPLLRVLKVGTLLPLTIFVFSLFLSKTINNSEVLNNKNTRWFIFFLFLIFISVLTANITFNAFTKFKDVLGYILVYFVIAKEINKINRMKGLFFILVLSHIIIAILSPDIILHPEVRSYTVQGAFLGDGNDFSLSISIVIPFCIFLLLETDKKMRKFLYLIFLIILILCIIGTSSRGGSIALAALLVYQWIRSKKKIYGLILIAMLLALVVIYAPSTYLERMESIGDYQTEGSAQGRIMAWKSAVSMAMDHPLLGVGAGHFPVKYGLEYRPPGFGVTELPWANAHSIYFQALGELGFPGIFFLLMFIISNLISNEKRLNEIRKYNTDKTITYERLFICLNSSLIAFAVGGNFLSAFYYPHLIIIAGLFVAGQFIYKESREHILNVML